VDLSPYESVYTEHSHEAAAHAVKLARKKKGGRLDEGQNRDFKRPFSANGTVLLG